MPAPGRGTGTADPGTARASRPRRKAPRLAPEDKTFTAPWPDAGFEVSARTVDVSSRESLHALAAAAAAHVPADRVADSLHAHQLANRGNSLRVMAETVRWGRRGARVNTISDGAFITGSDFLMDGGVTAAYFYGDLAPK